MALPNPVDGASERVVLPATRPDAACRAAGSVLLLLAALLSGGLGYAEGGRLAKQMPGWQVIGWALVLALPVTVPIVGGEVLPVLTSVAVVFPRVPLIA